MGRLRRTWELAKTSWEVLRHDRELLVLPVLSFVATLVVMASFAVPFLATTDTSTTTEIGPAQYALLAAFYIVMSTVTVYFQTALVSAAHDRLSGGDPTIGSALRGANRHLPQVLGWGALTGTVSLVLRLLEERFGFLGRLVISIIGVAWSLATFLVVPTYVVEDVGPIDAVKRSGAMLKRTWGENLAAQAGFGLLGFLAALVALPVVLLGGAVAGGVGFAVTGVIAVLWIGAVAVVVTALSAIFQTALFHYAASGEAPGSTFGTAQLAGAFRKR